MKVEYKYFILSTIMFVVIAIVILQVDKYYDNKVKNNYTLETNKISSQYINIDDFGIYLQNAQDKTKYDLSKDNNYPKSGYVLNESKTECYDYNGNKQTGKVSQTDEGNVRLETTISIYCKMYFDIDNTPPTIKEFSIVGSSGSPSGYTLSTNVTYKLTWNEEDVTKYCIQSANNSGICSWISKSTSVSTISVPLQTGDGLKTMYAFVKDRANNISQVRTSTITLDENNPIVTNIIEKTKDDKSITVTIEGNDGTGSGISKIECRAKSPKETSWEVQDNLGNCKISNLGSGTKYTIEGRITDKVGKVSTRMTKEIETDIGYTCPDGGELVNDPSKGWICKVKATKVEETYWTCSKNSTEYSTKEAAESACTVTKTGSCETANGYLCKNGNYYLNVSDVRANCYSGTGSCSKNYVGWSDGPDHTDLIYYCSGTHLLTTYWDWEKSCAGGNIYSIGQSDIWAYRCDGSSLYESPGESVGYYLDESSCSASCFASGDFSIRSGYKCSINQKFFSLNSDCTSGCTGPVLDGTVQEKSKEVSGCSLGWAALSGSGSSLVCYKNAFPPAASKILKDSKGINKTLQGDMFRYQGECNATGGGCTGKVDNFICFGNGQKCDLTSDNMYRIIGIKSDGRLKVIKNTGIKDPKPVNSSYTNRIKWHNAGSGNILYNQSDIYKRLNGITSDGTNYPNLFIGNNSYSYMNNTTWTNKIKATSWPYLDMYMSYYGTSGTADSVYNKEFSSTTSVDNAKIGLMYIHDYMYSGKSGGGNCYFEGTDYATCKKSWLHVSNNGNSADNLEEWTMARNGYDSNGGTYVAWSIKTDGKVKWEGVTNTYIVRPVFFLSSDISITGNGTSTDPFVVH